MTKHSMIMLILIEKISTFKHLSVNIIFFPSVYTVLIVGDEDNKRWQRHLETLS
jgi:hypothetical protein